jgi:PAS domain S-box-containing protein
VGEIKDRILVVDDDESLLQLLEHSLKRYGYDVVAAGDGSEALTALETSSPFAVLVTDLLMPNLSGLDLIRMARQLDPHLQTIVITAADSLEMAISVLREGGVYDYLQKPFDSIEQLALVVQRAVDHRQLLLEREALQRLAEADARRLKVLVSNVGEAILVVSEKGEIALANPAAEKMIGSAGVEGRQALEVLPPRLLRIVEDWQAHGSQAPIVLEIPWQGENMQMLSLTPIHDRQENWQGWALVMRDITPFKRLDDLKTQAMADAIAHIRRPLAEAMSALAELSALAAQDECLAGAVYTLTDAWNRIQATGDALAKMAHKDTSQESQVTEVDLAQLILAIEKELNAELYWQGMGKFTVTLEDQPGVIYTDPDMLYQLLKGLLKRAATRSPYGASVCVSAREMDQRVYIDVVDAGPSVTNTGLLHMFDKSLMDASPSGDKSQLGLSQAKALLDKVGGQLWVTGEDSRRGSTITICLPEVAQVIQRKVF